MKPTKIGIIGCGNICGIYFQAGKTFEILDIVACADLVNEKAEAKAEEHGCKVMSVDDLLANPEIKIVMNLTVPDAHAPVAFKILEAGKSVYNEKPLAITREDGKKMLELAKSKGVLVGCAPDTFLGGGIQTCRKLIDDGWIGTPVAATAFMMGFGVETWHPNPEFYYKPGGGPMFDMGPYYLTALVNLVGPIKKVAGMTKINFNERLITSQPFAGKVIQVEVDTHVAGIMEFQNGSIGTIITSFDIPGGHNMPRIEVYGSEGSMSVPDPNTFGGPVLVRRGGSNEWKEVPLTHGHAENSRGLGVADMAYALQSGRPHRASGDLAYHVLDVMHAFHDASRGEKHIKLESKGVQPAPLPLGLPHGKLDE